MGRNRTHIILVFTTVILLTIPSLQMFSKFIQVKPLSGVSKKQKLPSFNFQDWVNYQYQPQLYTYLLENYGIREDFIRIYNQFHFNFYNKGNSNVMVGKDNYLFEPWFIFSYNGENYIGDKKIKDQIHKIQMVQDTLHSLNKELLVFLSPGKVSYWPEFVPEKHFSSENKPSNYTKYSEELGRSKINYIDGNAWFIAAKDTSLYPLFPKTGTHWSFYGSCLAYDSIIRFITKNTSFHLVDTQITNIHPTSNLKKTDTDIENILNLLLPLDRLELPYPTMKLLNPEEADQPNTVVISDSYFWNIFNDYPTKNKVFNDFQFWYYNKTIYPDSYKKPTQTTDLNFTSVVDKTDLFVLMACPQTIENLGWGFIDRSYDHFYNNTIMDSLQQKQNTLKQDKHESILVMINNIKRNKKWFSQIKEKAKSRGITVDSMLYLDARYLINKKHK